MPGPPYGWPRLHFPPEPAMNLLRPLLAVTLVLVLASPALAGILKGHEKMALGTPTTDLDLNPYDWPEQPGFDWYTVGWLQSGHLGELRIGAQGGVIVATLLDITVPTPEAGLALLQEVHNVVILGNLRLESDSRDAAGNGTVVYRDEVNTALEFTWEEDLILLGYATESAYALMQANLDRPPAPAAPAPGTQKQTIAGYDLFLLGQPPESDPAAAGYTLFEADEYIMVDTWHAVRTMVVGGEERKVAIFAELTGDGTVASVALYLHYDPYWGEDLGTGDLAQTYQAVSDLVLSTYGHALVDAEADFSKFKYTFDTPLESLCLVDAQGHIIWVARTDRYVLLYYGLSESRHGGSR